MYSSGIPQLTCMAAGRSRQLAICTSVLPVALSPPLTTQLVAGLTFARSTLRGREANSAELKSVRITSRRSTVGFAESRCPTR